MKLQLVFTVYFPYQIGIIAHVTISKKGRFSAGEKLLVILVFLRQFRE